MKYRVCIIFILLLSINYLYAETLIVSSALLEDNPTFKAQAEFYKETSSKIPGLDIELISLPLERCRISLLNGTIDGDSGRSDYVYIGENSAVKVNTPIFSVDYVIFTKDTNMSFSGIEDLKKYSVVAMRGDIASTKFAEDNGLEIKFVNNIEQGFIMLEKGRMDIFLTVSQYSAFIRTGKYSYSGIRIIDPPVFSIPMYLFINVKHQKYIKVLEEAIQELYDSGKSKEFFPN